MSLVICSNQDADGQSQRQSSSVYKPWAFRNTLSSTYKIPANAQVALQSCKVNIDGRIVISEANSKFYQFFGEKLNLDGITEPQMEDTTSYPIFTSMLPENESGILELSISDFANTLQKAIRQTTFYPNVKNEPTVEVLRNASSLDFLGYKFTYNQNTDKFAGVPANGAFEQWFRSDAPYDDESGAGIFSYSGGVFTRETDNAEEVCAAICPTIPMDNLNGEFAVNISGTSGRANASGVEWHVGLSRYINNTDYYGYYYPSYFIYESPSGNFNEELFADFAIARNTLDELILYQYSWSDTYGGLVYEEIQYWDNASSYFSGGAVDLDGVDYTDVKFTVTGERVKAEIYDNASSAWRTITEYNSGQPKNSYFKPVHQACWCLHPVLAVGQKTGATDCTLEITDFNSVRMTHSDYDPKVKFKGGWFETMELEGTDNLCRNLESRAILQTDDTTATYEQVGVNASDGIIYDNVFILQESEVYEISSGANARLLLGFNRGIVDTPSDTINLNQKVFESDTIPSLTNSLSMFVRLNNFGQNCTNARVGNKSKILAHLTDLETTSGRQTYEPKNLIFLDLDNPAELNVNEFDISFCYANEQFAQTLTGQSIVCLYFREKPKM